MLMFWGCMRSVRPEPELMPEVAWVPPEPAGDVSEGFYRDWEMGFLVPVPEGWRAQPALKGDTTRVVFESKTGVKVRVRVGTEAVCVPTWSEGIGWNVGLRDDVVLATCTPLDHEDPRILVWSLPSFEPPLQFEATVPDGELLATELALGLMVAGLGEASP